MINKFISIKTVFAKIYRDLNINYEIPEIDMLEWSAEALTMIGAFSQYEQITTYLDIDSSTGKLKLPCGFEKLVDINYCGLPIYWNINTNRHNFECSGCKIPDYQYNTHSDCNPNTFYINNNYLIFNLPNADISKKIELTYLGILTDEEGYPMVPDDIYYIKALTAYITYMLDKQEWRKGKIPDKVYNDSERDWLFYVNSARGSANMPNIAQLENLKNTLRRLLPIPNDYKSGFRRFNKTENLRKDGRY